jgi:aldose 1-epimerase
MTNPEEDITIANGPARARIMRYGATLRDLRLEGVAHSLVLGSPDPGAYRGPMQFFGAIVGPVANRIAKGRAPLGRAILKLDVNENDNALHGGDNGLWCREWDVEDVEPHRAVLSLTHPDGDGGLPGPMRFEVAYGIEADGALTIDITATSPVPTLCNPAFHGYWCLGENGLAGHRLRIDADHYLPTDAELIPTGEVATVAGTAYDLREPVALPAAVAFDTNFCLNGTGLRRVARLESDTLTMEVETDAPGLQVYDAARLDTSPAIGHAGAPYGAYAGLAMEPQGWPDAPNHPDFPSIMLQPEVGFRQASRFSFIRKQAG